MNIVNANSRDLIACLIFTIGDAQRIILVRVDVKESHPSLLVMKAIIWRTIIVRLVWYYKWL